MHRQSYVGNGSTRQEENPLWKRIVRRAQEYGERVIRAISTQITNPNSGHSWLFYLMICISTSVFLFFLFKITTRFGLCGTNTRLTCCDIIFASNRDKKLKKTKNITAILSIIDNEESSASNLEKENSSNNAKSSAYVDKSKRLHPDRSRNLKLIELRRETYYGMVRLLKPGCRTIVLLCDDKTKDILLPKFKNHCWPYRRNKSLLFGYVMLEKNVFWFRDILEKALGTEGLQLNPSFCVGTVLVLNGFRKYFCVYHVKHHELPTNITGDTEEESLNSIEEDGFLYLRETSKDFLFDIENSLKFHTLGLPENNHIDNQCGTGKDTEHCGLDHRLESLPVKTIQQLLNCLPEWLDRVFEGRTKRFFIDTWPVDMS